jgi:hypothetical protein
MPRAGRVSPMPHAQTLGDSAMLTQTEANASF